MRLSENAFKYAYLGFVFYVSGCFYLRIYLCIVCVRLVSQDQKRALDLLRLELEL